MHAQCPVANRAPCIAPWSMLYLCNLGISCEAVCVLQDGCGRWAALANLQHSAPLGKARTCTCMYGCIRHQNLDVLEWMDHTNRYALSTLKGEERTTICKTTWHYECCSIANVLC